MRWLMFALLVLPVSGFAWTNLQPQYVNLPPGTREEIALLLAGRSHGGPRGGGGPAISSQGGPASTPGTFGADPATRGEPSGVIQLQPVPSPPQPVQLQMQRVQPTPGPQPVQFQLIQVPPVVQPQPVQWEGSTTVALPITIRLGVGQAVSQGKCE